MALWSTTCQGSRKSLAALRELHETYGSRGVRFLILANDPTVERLVQFVDSAQLDVPMVHAPDLKPFDFAEHAVDTDEYRVVFSLPSFLVVSSNGIVVARSGGMLSDAVLVRALDSLTADAGAQEERAPRDYTREGPPAVSSEGSGFRGVSFHFIVPSRKAVDEVMGDAVAAGGAVVKEAAAVQWGYFGSFSNPDGYLWKVASPS